MSDTVLAAPAERVARERIDARVGLARVRRVKIAVCVKQVPDATSHKRLDAATHRLDRSGEGALNATDVNAVEEAPALLHPRMAQYYQRQITRLVEALRHHEKPLESVEGLRSLIEKVVLTPTDEGRGLRVDILGDAGRIMEIAREGEKDNISSNLAAKRAKAVGPPAPRLERTGVALKAVGPVGLEPTTKGFTSPRRFRREWTISSPAT